MPKIKIIASQTVMYEKEIDLTNEEIKKFRDRLENQDSFEPDELYLDADRDFINSDEIDSFDVEVFIDEEGNWNELY